MITGVHALIYTKKANSLRAFFRDVLDWPSVDAREGWLIFAPRPAELGIHPTDAVGYHELYLMCDDINATIDDLKNKGVEITRPIRDEGFGYVTSLRIPGANELWIYEPKHKSPLPSGRRR